MRIPHGLRAAAALKPKLIECKNFINAESVTVPSTVSGQMRVLHERVSSTQTPPALRSGWTNILTLASSGSNSAIRISYQTGAQSSLAFTATGQGAWWIFNNGVSVGNTNTVNTNTITTTPTLPSINLTSLGARSLVLASSYVPNITGVSSPYTRALDPGGRACGAIAENLNTSSLAQGNFTFGSSFYDYGYAIELLA